MFPLILFLFIAVPIIEIGLFIQVGGYLGLWPTIGLVLITAFVGASLVRSQGLQTLLTVQQRLQAGELPAQQILEGVLLAVAGVLLLTPGFMTDFMGMFVLLPGPRAMLARKLMAKVVIQGNVQQPFGTGEPHDRQSHRGNTYEGEYDRKDDDDDHDKLN
ncbi:phage T7 F exclusion suppressor FxsA [Vibrio ruber DSM 16370]|uniref:Phage T7 F exclusion suppressor FxsA n=1 Tax=Vibrio ruber (strain DSM 16370 / JCM 11486 / BCRC 17186 / CECT 7878 / LMG 23124 / VR1) TaxID=1123498 RepID=A0A1R4LLB8_VIBR1|nr:FxsA family protein [Vibrio ruber]SJN57401.1 phage T7 F exclusion suppressor FxsA [Vibrio ruber DSM 16370]